MDSKLLTVFAKERNYTLSKVDKSLLKTQKPVRYLGGEINAVGKDLSLVKLRVALCFPDVYEIGMSHLGLKILYSIINSHPDYFAERVFAPWSDREAVMRETGAHLESLETHSPLNQFDIIGFSLQYELCATNVLQMLDLGGIPILSSDRDQDHSLVIAGGPICFNPAPFTSFIDAFVIGDGEEVILEIAAAHVQWKEDGGARSDLLKALNEISGVYVPDVHIGGEKTCKRIVPDLNQATFPDKLVVPFTELIHDRVGIEISRGCTRGCRFCQAGMLYRPVRERAPEHILDVAERSLNNSGWGELALLSLSTGDYSCLSGLVHKLVDKYSESRTSISLPSMRTDTFDENVINYIRKIRQSGLTLAPEAGTDRLRAVINKGNNEADLEQAVRSAFVQGQKKLKLYFMIGLPTENCEDLDGIIDLVGKTTRWAKGGAITASVSNFVPKAHTPFQWAKQIGMEEMREKRDYILQRFRQGRARLKFHNPKMSFLEGVIARGDERVGDVILEAYQQGARFDGWDEKLNFGLWMHSFEKHSLDPEQFLRQRKLSETLPWSVIDCGINGEFLKEEYAKALNHVGTPDCRTAGCVGCGVCDFESVEPRFAEIMEAQTSTEAAPVIDQKIFRFQLLYQKLGNMSLLGHQDIVKTFERAFRRAGLLLDYSKGFHPHPKLKFSPPTAVGIESHCEYLEFDLIGKEFQAEGIHKKMVEQLPNELKPVRIEQISLNHRNISSKIKSTTYHISEGKTGTVLLDRRRFELFKSAEKFEISVSRKGKVKTRDLKKSVLDANSTNQGYYFTLTADHEQSAHPLDVLSAIFGITREQAGDLNIVKTAVSFE